MSPKMLLRACRALSAVSAAVLNVVVTHKTHLAIGRVGHVVLFSSNLTDPHPGLTLKRAGASSLSWRSGVASEGLTRESCRS